MPKASCSNKYLVCATCKITFFRAQVKFNIKNFFCSRKCYHEHLKLDETDFWERAEKGPNCWFWKKTIDFYGYGIVGVKNKKAHRMAWILTHGEIPPGMCVCHKCDNRACVNPDHLFLGTSQENNKDRDNKGRQAKGEKSSHAKLTKDRVLEIRSDFDSGLKAQDIAIKFGMGLTAVYSIRKRHTWKHV